MMHRLTRLRACGWVPVALFASIVLCTLAGRVLHAQRSNRVPPPAGSAVFDWQLFALNGERLTLQTFRGRVLVINHWATWCTPCLEELPSLSALRAAVPDTSVAFLLVTPQSRLPVTEFVRRRGITLPVYLEATPVPRIFGFEAVPTTWVLDRSGAIVLKRRGAMRWDTPEMIALLRTLLAEAAVDRPD